MFSVVLYNEHIFVIIFIHKSYYVFKRFHQATSNQNKTYYKILLQWTFIIQKNKRYINNINLAVRYFNSK